MYEFVVGALAFVAVAAFGGAWLSARAASRQALRGRLGEHESPSTAVDVSQTRTRLVGTVERMATAASLGRPSPRLREELARAGFHGHNAAPIYLGAKVLLLVIGLFALTALLLPFDAPLPVIAVLVVAGAALLSFLPNMYLRVRRGKRRHEIRSHLPDALDLLEVCVSAGMGLDMAWNAVTDEFRGVSPMLADEMALTNLELHLGSPRATAMRRMAERTGADEVSSLVAVLVQSDRFGTSVSEALRTFAESMREQRSQLAAEAAEKMAVKLIFPMVFFIFPTVFVVIVGPAIIKLVEVLSLS